LGKNKTETLSGNKKEDKMLITNKWLQDLKLMKVNEGAAGGSGGAGAQGQQAQQGPDVQGQQTEKTFTQDQINKMLAEHKRGLKNELETLKNTLSDKDSTIQELQAAQEQINATLAELSKAAAEKGAKVNIDTNKPLQDIVREMAEKVTGYEGTIKELKGEFGKRIEDLESNLEKESSLRQIAEEEALVSERDMVLQRALAKSGCIDMEVGLKLFEDCCEIDDETGEWWVVNDKTGEEWPLLEGVGKMLPNYLKRPVTDQGGAGSRGSGMPMSEIERSKSRVSEIDGEMKSLQDEYQKKRSPNILAKVQNLMRERNELLRNLRLAKV
jgi:hypothetical protein